MRVFKENFNFLAALFDKWGVTKVETSLELSKDELINMLTESAILIDRGGAAEESKDTTDLKKRFTKQTITLMLSKTHGLESDSLGYVDFLEALMSIAAIYPFNEQD